MRQYSALAHVRRTSKGEGRSSDAHKNSPPLEGRLWEAARLASLLKKFPSSGGAALGGGASRVASQEIPLPRRGGERSETEWLGILGVS
ncbi:MAG: hypothetical protein IJD43_07535, partial [Thermoguttaceae bacterium]|nr:hypothetical protein [Thermoguttaceae bacterium]